MNTHGNPVTLVASHPGNTNAVKYGVYSPRMNAPRAAEIAAELTESFEFSSAQRVAVEQMARCIATLEAIDLDLDERGIVDKRGEVRSVLKYQLRFLRELDSWRSMVASSIERQAVGEQLSSPPTQADLNRELHRIVLDSTVSPRDRILAIKELRHVGPASSEVTVVHLSIPADRMPPRLRPKTPDGDGNAVDLSTPL